MIVRHHKRHPELGLDRRCRTTSDKKPIAAALLWKSVRHGEFGDYIGGMTETVASNVMERVLDPLSRNLTAEAARILGALRLDDASQARLEELASRNTEGQLTPEERAEYDAWVSACDLVAILQSKARAWLNHAHAG